MPSLLESEILQDSFSTPEMRQIFSARNLLQKWLDVEAALARAEAKVGLIPAEAAEEITRQARAENFDLEEIRQGIRETHHPIVPVVRVLTRLCRDNTGEYVHWGATTQDITDTGLMLMLKDVYDLLEKELDELIRVTVSAAQRYRDVVMPGRTHGQHALPITFGYKVAVWASELDRHRQRLRESRPRVLVGQFGGAVGTLAAIGPAGLQVRKLMMEDLGLGEPDITWHAARDRVAEFAGLLGLMAGTLNKIAVEIINLQRTELAEVEEPFHFGKVGSSTMPHKRNPMICEAMQALATMVRQDAGHALAAMVQEHERGWPMLQLELGYLPRMAAGVHSLLRSAIQVIEGLHVYPEHMERNLNMLKGLILSEAVMIELAKTIGRQTAHDVVYRASMRAFEADISLADALAQEEEVTQHLSAEEINALLDPKRYTGLATTFVDEIVARLGG